MTAAIPHERFCRSIVIPDKSDQGSEQRTAEGSLKGKQKQQRGNCRKTRQAVESVGDVHRIDKGGDEQYCKRVIPPSELQRYRSKRQGCTKGQHGDQNDRGEELQSKLSKRRKPVASFMALFEQVVDEADRSERQESDKRIDDCRGEEISFKECGDRRAENERDAPDYGSSLFFHMEIGQVCF